MHDCPWNALTCANAAEGGHLEVLQWLRKNGCPWDDKTTRNTAFRGHLAILQWAVENKCPGNSLIWAQDAIAWGHLDVLQWLHARFSNTWDYNWVEKVRMQKPGPDEKTRAWLESLQ